MEKKISLIKQWEKNKVSSGTFVNFFNKNFNDFMLIDTFVKSYNDDEIKCKMKIYMMWSQGLKIQKIIEKIKLWS